MNPSRVTIKQVCDITHLLIVDLYRLASWRRPEWTSKESHDDNIWHDAKGAATRSVQPTVKKNCAGDASDATLLPALDPERLILQDLFQELVSPTNVSHSGPGDESDWLITTWIEMRVNNDYLIAS